MDSIFNTEGEMRKLIFILLFIPVVGWGQIAGAWKLTSNANDYSGTGNNATATNVTYLQGGYIGNYGSYNSTSSKAIFPKSTTLELSGNFSITALVNPASLSGTKAIYFYDNGGSTFSVAYAVYIIGNKLVIDENKSSAFTLYSTIVFPNDGKWHFVAFLRNHASSQMTFIIDNTIETVAWNGNTNNSGNPYFGPSGISGGAVGAYDDGSFRCCYFNGGLADVKVYTKLLSIAEALNQVILYKNGFQ